MKRFSVLFAAGVLLIPAVGCQDNGGEGGPTTTPSPAATTTTPTTAPTGKAAKDSDRRAKTLEAAANPNGPKHDH